jgi:acyl-CoA thioester hydrolase
VRAGRQDSIPVMSEVRLRVRYAETDQMGVAYHSNHFIWFEVGRVELLRQLGFSYKDMEQKDNCHMPVVDARCRYRVPAVYDEEIIVRTHLRNVRESVVRFGYELRRANDGRLLATGETMHIAVDSEKKITSFPEKYVKALQAAMGK